MKKFFLSLLVVIVLGGIAVGFVAKRLVDLKNQRDQAAQSETRKDIKITIIEGKRREEIAAQLATAGICGYDDFMAASQNLEGALFPDTYRFFANASAADVVAVMNQDYQTRTRGLSVTRDQLILASIVEREALNDTDRPIIAGVYENRLQAGMFLGSDPTVQYAKDSQIYALSVTPQTFKFWQPITQADYTSVVSPYNTYLNKGLPAGPLANPGLKSIEAAQNPGTTDALYFLYKNGQLLLSTTLQEHEAQAGY